MSDITPNTSPTASVTPNGQRNNFEEERPPSSSPDASLPVIIAHATGEGGDPVAGAGFSLPRTLYVWAVILALSYILPPVFVPNRARHHLTATKEATLSSSDFTRYVTAETHTRTAYGLGGLAGGLGAVGGMGDQRDKSLAEATQEFGKLAKTNNAPNLWRRILILEHEQKLPLNKRIVNIQLPQSLKEAGRKPINIASEQKLWQNLYGVKRVAPADVATDSTRIKAMHLRFLEGIALAHVNEAAGRKAEATAERVGVEKVARRFLLQQGLLSVGLLIGVLVGLVLFVVAIVAVANQRWTLIARVATEPQRLGWGDLLDAFVFYLALVHGVGLGVGLLAVQFIKSPTPFASLMLTVGVYVGTGAVALLYLLVKAHSREVTLRDIGFTTRGGLLANIGYGIAGYCAILPMTYALGFLSRLIFGESRNTSPNPILPLITTETNPLARFTIYLLVAVGAPFFEEMFFRGALFSALRTRFQWPVAAVLSGLVFAVVHPIQDWLPIFGLGFGLAMMREMRQSLVPGMVAHCIQNSMAFLLLSGLFQQ